MKAEGMQQRLCGSAINSYVVEISERTSIPGKLSWKHLSTVYCSDVYTTWRQARLRECTQNTFQVHLDLRALKARTASLDSRVCQERKVRQGFLDFRALKASLAHQVSQDLVDHQDHRVHLTRMDSCLWSTVRLQKYHNVRREWWNFGMATHCFTSKETRNLTTRISVRHIVMHVSDYGCAINEQILTALKHRAFMAAGMPWIW